MTDRATYRDLGMDRRIPRRDFLSGVAIGIASGAMALRSSGVLASEGPAAQPDTLAATYPPARTISGTFTPLGVITLDVPVADVGGNSKASLVSITGLTVTQATPSSTGDTIFNQIDATRPFDLKP